MLAERIVATNEKVKSKVAQINLMKKQVHLQSLATQPLEQVYSEMLSPLRFEYMNMKLNDKAKNFKHAFDNQA